MILSMGRPQPKQQEFLRAKTRFVAYGGARGGGKSWAVRCKAALLGFRYPGIKMLLIRRTFPELRENHILPMRQMLGDAAVYREAEHAFTFPGGGRLRFGYCETDNDVLQYQGQEYDIIFLDEATQFTEFQFSTLTACIRGANDFPKRFYLTCNPGGVGHTWVKRLFVDRDYQGAERPEDYSFIRATVKDNAALVEKDPEYVRMLENLPPDLRRAWLEGDWDLFLGQYFPEFRREIHVAEPFEIPAHWRRYFAMDYGLDMLAGYCIALDDHGRAIVYREIYESNLIISEAAKKVQAMTKGEQIHAFYAPPDLWNRRQDTGKSVADLFRDHGIILQRADNRREAGWANLKEWLAPFDGEDGAKTAALRMMSNCKNLIRTLPALQHDDKNPCDVATDPHELTHAPDAIRYFIAGRPSPAPKPKEKPVFGFAAERPKADPIGRGDTIEVI